MDFIKKNRLLRKKIEKTEHEEIISYQDEKTGLKTILAIHSSVLGPALGGVRMIPYKREEEALEDVLTLSQGMSYKSAFLGTHYGGGKAVIIGDPRKDKSEALFRSFGRFVESLNGRYITAKDFGIDINDLTHIVKETSYLAGKPKSAGGIGDPSIYTAYGLFKGLKAAVKYKLHKDSFDSISVVIQGVGSVGRQLVKYLNRQQAIIKISDINQKKIKTIIKTFPSVTQIMNQDTIQNPCDILSPCALGKTIHENIIEKLNCKIIAGAANNQLSKFEVADGLRKKNILYVPDFVINSGGLASVALEYSKTFTDEETVFKQISEIEQKITHMLEKAKKENITPLEFAFQIVKNKLN